jgi:phosphohistidine phosphatase
VKIILLLRHAKSAWGQPGLDDHERPLNKRGERAAEAMAEHIVHNAPRPDLILCSTAVRTRQTLAPLVHRLAAPAPPIALEKGLYLASEGELLVRLRAVAEDVGTVLLIGHNEGIGELADALAGEGEPAALAALHEKFPTGALATLQLDAGPWRDLAPGAAELLAFVRPRDLEG